MTRMPALSGRNKIARPFFRNRTPKQVPATLPGLSAVCYKITIANAAAVFSFLLEISENLLDLAAQIVGAKR